MFDIHFATVHIAGKVYTYWAEDSPNRKKIEGLARSKQFETPEEFVNAMRDANISFIDDDEDEEDHPPVLGESWDDDCYAPVDDGPYDPVEGYWILTVKIILWIWTALALLITSAAILLCHP